MCDNNKYYHINIKEWERMKRRYTLKKMKKHT